MKLYLWFCEVVKWFKYLEQLQSVFAFVQFIIQVFIFTLLKPERMITALFISPPVNARIFFYFSSQALYFVSFEFSNC